MGQEPSSRCVQDYLGSVVPNFWGTSFTLYDSGVDVGSRATCAWAEVRWRR